MKFYDLVDEGVAMCCEQAARCGKDGGSFPSAQCKRVARKLIRDHGLPEDNFAMLYEALLEAPSQQPRG